MRGVVQETGERGGTSRKGCHTVLHPQQSSHPLGCKPGGDHTQTPPPSSSPLSISPIWRGHCISCFSSSLAPFFCPRFKQYWVRSSSLAFRSLPVRSPSVRPARSCSGSTFPSCLLTNDSRVPGSSDTATE